MNQLSEQYDAAYGAEQIARSNSVLRRAIKRHYIASALREVDGPTVDLGCGAGQLLERLPAGSIGLEINQHLIRHLTARKQNVLHYDALADDFALSPLTAGAYRTLIASHVLEHFDDSASTLRKLAAACARLGISRIVIVVPGWKGYLSDATHRTFVTPRYIREHGLVRIDGYALNRTRFFPFNMESAGRWFVYNECIFVWESVR